MGQLIDWRKNSVLREMYEEARGEGVEEGLSTMLQVMLAQMFGQIPGWALQRIASADHGQLLKWGANTVRAKSLESVIGPRR